ncbi:MAG: amino acid adenylation domain-containing protein [Candidatus Aminicenantes bacterium]|jgi:amino acid adenylation domain-containing protein
MKNQTSSKKVSLALDDYGEEKDYWLDKLAGQLTKTNFPYDFYHQGPQESPRVKIENTAELAINFSSRLCERLLKISKKSDYTLHMILVAGMTVLLNKYTGAEDIMVGMPIYRQSKEGEFLNTVLVLRNQLQPGMNFKNLLLQVRQTVMEANDNQNYPIETLLYQLNIPYQGDEFPLFDVVVLVENIHEKKYIQHIHPNMLFSFSRSDGTITGLLEYNALLYNAAAAMQVIGRFCFLLEALVYDPDTPLGRFEMLTEPERTRLLFDFNRTWWEYPRDKTIAEIFVRQAVKRPDKTAVVYENHSLTYRELNRRTRGLAGYLLQLGVKEEEPVAVMAKDSLDVIVGILGILKVGACYLPLNTDDPPQRQEYLLKDGNVRLVLTNCKEPDRGFQHVMFADLREPGIYKNQPSPPAVKGKNNLAYIIYTSGSTGEPKGVMAEHRGVLRLVINTNYITFNPGDRVLLTGALEFDASTFEIWGPLLNGLQLILAGKDTILSPFNLKETVSRNDVGTMWMTAPLFNRMVDADIDIFRGLNNLLVGGDVLSTPHINRLKKRFPLINLINGYGPTENTTFSTTHLIEGEYTGPIPIGKPIANSTVYITGSAGLQPPGVVGELCVGGDGLARGYMNNPELTAERFDHENQKFLWGSRGRFLQKESPGRRRQRIYKTGDRARWLENGIIEFLGRQDHQVKIRGYRIEPAEIQRHLVDGQWVKEAIVIVREREDGEKYLCAYLAVAPPGISPGCREGNPGQSEINITQMREKLAKKLPDYMIPGYLVTLEKIPLTANGKVDRKALPAPETALAARCTPPRNEIEKKFTGIWADILGVEKDKIGIDTDFFELGGHSLKATILISRMHKEFNIKVPLAEIFRAPTIRELSRYIKRKAKNIYSIYSMIKNVEKKEYYPLSPAQKRMYIQQQIGASPTHYNIPMELVMAGEIDIKPLEKIFQRLMRRHESLRTSFRPINREPVQVIHERVEFSLERQAPRFSPADFVRPFNLAHPPLIRAGLNQLGPKKYLLMLDMHHIITDGTSLGIFLKEFAACHEGKELPGLRLQYKDFSHWQNNLIHNGGMKRQQEYWLDVLSGEIPVLDLPLDYSRPAVQTFDGDICCFTLEPQQESALKEIAREKDATLFMIYLALYSILISRLSCLEDIIIGTPVAGRRHADLENIMGMFINMLPLRNFPKPGKTFIDFLGEVKNRTLEAFENQDYQFETLVEQMGIKRDVSRSPLFDVVFVMQNMDIPVIETDELVIKPRKTRNNIAKFDLLLTAEQQEDQLLFTFSYYTKIFKKETVIRFINYFKELVTIVIKEKNIQLKEIKLSQGLLTSNINMNADEYTDFGF